MARLNKTAKRSREGIAEGPAKSFECLLTGSLSMLKVGSTREYSEENTISSRNHVTYDSHGSSSQLRHRSIVWQWKNIAKTSAVVNDGLILASK